MEYLSATRQWNALTEKRVTYRKEFLLKVASWGLHYLVKHNAETSPAIWFSVEPITRIIVTPNSVYNFGEVY